MFDWITFLNRRGIEYTDKGSSATVGNVAVSCPFCGAADPGTHLAISIHGRGWRCWRNKAHSGRSPVRLIQALLGCTWVEAERLAGVSSARSTVAQNDFGAHVAGLLVGSAKTPVDGKPLDFLPEFRPLLNEGAGKPFAEYLVEQRDYRYRDVPNLCAEYGLRCATTGRFRWRVIFPVYHEDTLVCWTGRTLSTENDLRYMTLSANPETAAKYELPIAKRSIERTLWNYDNLRDGGDTLIICEGPFDAMRVDYYGADYGVRACAVYTKSVSDDQVLLLDDVAHKFKRRVLLLDSDAALDVLGVQRDLAHLHFEALYLPPRFKDPGEMPKEALLDFIL